MPDIVALIATALIALGVGLAIGWTIGLRRRSKREVILDLETRLEHALESRADYEAEVAEHFNTTAQLLSRMTEDYRKVYTHLASGAEKLGDGEIKIPATSLGAVSDDEHEIPSHMVDLSQPLDYAPKRPDEQGQLSETFGLERQTSNETPSTIPPKELAS